MRNVEWASECGPVIGEIRNGKKYLYGCVTAEQYEQDMHNIEINLSGIAQSVSDIKGQMAAVKSDINTINVKVDNTSEVIRLIDNRINAVETATSKLTSRVSDIETVLAMLRNQHMNDTNNLRNRIDQLANNASVLKAEIQSVSVSVASLSQETAVSIAALNERVSNIEGGEAVEIMSFTATPNVAELGGTENIILAWTTRGDVKVTRINGDVVTGNELILKNVSSAAEYTLSVTDAKGITVSKKVSVTFVNHIYWGTDASGGTGEGVVKALDFEEMSDTRTRTITVNPLDQYVVYAYPKRLGTSTFMANGFTGGFREPATISIDNHSGYTEDYYVYRSENKLNVNFTIEIR